MKKIKEARENDGREYMEDKCEGGKHISKGREERM